MSEASAERVAVLRGLSLFSQVAEDDLHRVAAIARERRMAAGERLFRRGDPGSELYVIVDGAVRVQVGSRVLARMGGGEVVGELAVLDRRPRSADVVVVEDARLLEIRGEDFEQLLDRHPSLGRALLSVLAGRVREAGSRQARVDQLVRAYRERGHVLAQLDPLGFRRPGEHPELTPGYHGLDEEDLDLVFSVTIGSEALTMELREAIAHLRRTYCGAIGVQYMHIDDLRVQHWLRERLEAPDRPLPRDTQLRILGTLTAAEVFETFLHQTFVRAQRFSLEGAETLVPLLDQAIEQAGELGVGEIVMGMAHRGRLNVLANVLGKPASRIFQEFEDADSNPTARAGDVKYHLGHSTERTTASGRRVRLTLCFNPSHLEFVGPVVLGRARALQDAWGEGGPGAVLPLLIHGDAAFAGQGIIQESLNLGELPGYAVGGTVHVVLNNQIGFTTPPEQARSTPYATDVARMLQVPIFHVDGERPEAVDRVIRLAMDFRATFRRDVVIDMYCYRRHGHNERDEAAFTQPLLAAAIAARPPIRVTYAENLLQLGQLTRAEADGIAAASRQALVAELDSAKTLGPAPPTSAEPAAAPLPAPTADRLAGLLGQLGQLPEGFQPHPKVERVLAGRKAMARGERALDWGTGETLAWAWLLAHGVSVRLSGQDSERGTFAHRHAVVHDVVTGERTSPLQRLATGPASFEVRNSPLSEAAVLGFEFGYSLDARRTLVAWEAQFGDFVNGAQVIVDQFVSSAEDKWDQRSALTLILPHGFEGQGPEHSSARLERFLQLAAKDNVRIAQPTTASQVFHLLIEQASSARPLFLLSPKSLLVHPSTSSPLSELAAGAFQPVVSDAAVGARAARRAVLCGGQIHPRLVRARDEHARGGTAVVRLEQYYPFPAAALGAAIGHAESIVWVQEEPENMGAWSYLAPRLLALADGRPLTHVSRPESASPATGSRARHLREEQELLARVFA